MEGLGSPLHVGIVLATLLGAIYAFVREKFPPDVTALLVLLRQALPVLIRVFPFLHQMHRGRAANNSAGAAPSSGQMTHHEALAVLGLDEGASDEEIIAAHRRLMQKLHPDRDGNDYLAAKINQAKDFLLG